MSCLLCDPIRSVPDALLYRVGSSSGLTRSKSRYKLPTQWVNNGGRAYQHHCGSGNAGWRAISLRDGVFNSQNGLGNDCCQLGRRTEIGNSIPQPGAETQCERSQRSTYIRLVRIGVAGVRPRTGFELPLIPRPTGRHPYIGAFSFSRIVPNVSSGAHIQ